MDKVWEVIVERKLTNRYVVAARSGAEAAMQVGARIALEASFDGSEQVEVDRRMREPKVVKGADPQGDLFDAMRRGENPTEAEVAAARPRPRPPDPEGPTADEIAAARAQRDEDVALREAAKDAKK